MYPEEIQNLSRATIEDEITWPLWPQLPLKRYVDEQMFPEFGVLFPKTKDVYSVQLRMVNMPRTEDTKTVEYPTIDALLADGWVVD